MTSDELVKKAIVVVAIAAILPFTLNAGDAVAVGYNKDGVWTAVTYYGSSTPEGGKDYKISVEAIAEATRDLKARGGIASARIDIIATSDKTTFAAVARGHQESGTDLHVVGYGKSQGEADREAIAALNHKGAKEKQTIIYRYFSHGSDSK